MPITSRRTYRSTVVIAAALLLVWSSSCTDSPPPTAPPAAVPMLAIAEGATSAVLVGAGDIASCSSTGDEATAKLLDGIAGTVFTIGDNIAAGGTLADFNNCYNANWGRHKARTMPAPGEKDYFAPGAAGYFSYFGAAAGDPSKGYYSYNLGAWHVVVLNSGGQSMSASSAQAQWLRNDLIANRNYCTVAYWHHPLFYSGGPRTTYKAVWDILYKFGVDLVVNSHPRNYERLGPMTPDGVLDPEYGIRTIIAGTGGTSHGSWGVPEAPNLEVRDRSSYGVIKLTLSSDSSYAWQFVPVAGASFTDAGTAECHGTRPPVAVPGGPYGSEGTVTLDASASHDPAENDPLTYAWDFGDGTTGTGVMPTHAYAEPGTYTVTLTVTNASGTVSAPATTSVIIRNYAPVVTLGTDVTVQPTWDYDLWVRFTDIGTADGPWAYSINWGDGSSVVAGSATAQATVFGQTPTIRETHRFPGVGTYRVTVDVTDRDGATGSDTVDVTVRAPAATSAIFSGAGDIAECGRWSTDDEKTANILDTLPGMFFTVGDNAYPDGTDADFANCYEPSWGRHKARTYPVPGNHEYNASTTADGYFNYFNGFGNATGPAGERGKGYYSFDYAGWHVIVLNDNIPYAPGSPQEQWLRADLAANTSARCTMAIWHRPRFYPSGSGARPSMNAMWQPLYDAGADVVLAGHVHYYTRYARQSPDGIASPRGIRQFIIGTGGSSVGAQDGDYPNVEVQNGDTFGLMKFTLEADGYWWEFIPALGASRPGRFTDKGYSACYHPAS